MSDSQLTFTVSPVNHERIFVGLDAKTTIPGQHFSTGVVMTPRDWETLQETAAILTENALECARPLDAQSQYMADAYLAAVLMTPRYREDGKTFDADQFLPISKLYNEASYTAIHHAGDTSWQLATRMQAAMLKVKSWSTSEAVASGHTHDIQR